MYEVTQNQSLPYPQLLNLMMLLILKLLDVPLEQVLLVMADDLETVVVADAAQEAALQLVLAMADNLKVVVVVGAAHEADLQKELLMADNLEVVLADAAQEAFLPGTKK